MSEVERIMENRALLAALELSMLNLNNTTYSTASPDPPNGLFDDSPDSPLGSKKSQNITQCVSVPSSEHVAEIVGRQGCKIKALRAKTNTYIKTPVRGEEPIFIITGRPEDVSVAKKEILQAADHFSQIRASRRSSSGSPPNVGSTLTGSEEKVTIFVRVPYRVVGLVVGPKGATVKRIQQNTGTYIITPSRDMEPYFEVRGTPENVEQAKKEIESYIALRTGGNLDNLGSQADLVTNGTGSPSSSPEGVGVGRRPVCRTMSETTCKLLLPGGVPPPPSNAPTVSETHGRFEHRSSPLSSAVFFSGSQCNLEDDIRHRPIPMSAPVLTFDKVFDFGGGGGKPKQHSNNWNGSWSPQPGHVPNGSWGSSHQYYNKASPQPPSPTGSWGSSGGKLSPQPPSPTGSWGSSSSEGNTVMSSRGGFPNGLTSPSQGYPLYPQVSLMQRMQKFNCGGSARSCCFCELEEADTILIPCGHKSTCFDCACKIAGVTAACPCCNSKIDSLAQQVHS